MNDTVRALERQLLELKESLARARAEAAPQPVQNHSFQTADGPRTLSDLFGDQDDLFIIHNMGQSCSYCTLWADGFSGYQRHLTQRAAFVLVSPDAPATQEQLAAARGWTFPMAQDATRQFTTAMGMWSEEEGWWPGVSAFHKNEDGSVVRTGTTMFGPGDDFCMVWPMFELLQGGAKGWEPR